MLKDYSHCHIDVFPLEFFSMHIFKEVSNTYIILSLTYFSLNSIYSDFPH